MKVREIVYHSPIPAGLKMKAGPAYVHKGSRNWRFSKIDRWADEARYVPTGRETYVGTRDLAGRLHAVFKCPDKRLRAQTMKMLERQ